MTTYERWWEPRREGEDTAAYLGRVLEQLPAGVLASKALKFHYDDYRCPPSVDDGMNISRLVVDVIAWSVKRGHEGRARARAVIAAAKSGEFDGTAEEAAAWGRSPEGRAVVAELMNSSRRPRP